MHLLEIANFTESDECSRGECVTSITRLSKDTGWAYGVVRGILNRLEEENLISISTRKQKRGIVVKVCEYDQLQSIGTYKKEVNSIKTKEYEQPKLEQTNNQSNVYAFYENNIGVLTPMLAEKIESCIQDFENGEEVVVYAMEIAIEKNKLTWNFINGILKNWRNANLKTLDAIKADQERRIIERERKNKFNANGKPAKRETLPEWMKKEDVVTDEMKQQTEALAERIKNL